MEMKDIKQRQQKLIEMMRALDELGGKLHIRFFLVGGNALGACRHQGFIPWDDDLDIALFRKDFEILEQYFLQNGCRFGEYIYSPVEYHVIKDAPIGHMYQFTACQDEQGGYEMQSKVDIHPIDGVPSNAFLRKLQSISALGYYLFVYEKPFKNKGKAIRQISKWILKLTPQFMRKAYRKMFKSYFSAFAVEKQDTVCSLFGVQGYGKECMPKSFLEPLERRPFGEDNFFTPADLDLYLTRLYGDYKTLPPKEKQIPEHAHQRIRVKSLEPFYEPVKNTGASATIY